MNNENNSSSPQPEWSRALDTVEPTDGPIRVFIGELLADRDRAESMFIHRTNELEAFRNVTVPRLEKELADLRTQLDNQGR